MNEEKMPDVLYKYYPPERWKNVFKDWTIRFTPPNEFNDPFEYKPCYDNLVDQEALDKTAENIKKWKLDEILSEYHNSGKVVLSGFSGKKSIKLLFLIAC